MQSMTGFGDALEKGDRLAVSVEIRSVNNRYFKLSYRAPDGLISFEGEVERVLRESISRGAVGVQIRLQSVAHDRGPRINREVLESYWTQAVAAATQLGASPPELGRLLTLDGVIDNGSASAEEAGSSWPLVESALRNALQRFQEFRSAEGKATQKELGLLCDEIEQQVELIIAESPKVVAEFRERILQRVRDSLEAAGVSVQRTDLVREVAIFADRCDIHEEITRLKSHLEQFRKLILENTSQGRRLDFLCQELFREVNTIGSKSNSAVISQSSVEMKTLVERMREIVQNVE